MFTELMDGRGKFVEGKVARLKWGYGMLITISLQVELLQRHGSGLCFPMRNIATGRL